MNQSASPFSRFTDVEKDASFLTTIANPGRNLGAELFFQIILDPLPDPASRPDSLTFGAEAERTSKGFQFIHRPSQ